MSYHTPILSPVPVLQSSNGLQPLMSVFFSFGIHHFCLNQYRMESLFLNIYMIWYHSVCHPLAFLVWLVCHLILGDGKKLNMAYLKLDSALILTLSSPL